MQAVAVQFIRAKAAGNSGAAQALVKAVNVTQTTLLAGANLDFWTRQTGASCVGVICRIEPGTFTRGSLLMRKVAGRWWVAGLVEFPSEGPGSLVEDESAIYDPDTGQRALAGFPKGTSYWVTRSQENPRDRAYMRAVRQGAVTRVYVWLPNLQDPSIGTQDCLRLTAEPGSARKQVRSSYVAWSMLVPGGFFDMLDRSGNGLAWRTGRVAKTRGLVDLGVWNGVRPPPPAINPTSQMWTRSAYGKTLGARWKNVGRICDDNDPKGT